MLRVRLITDPFELSAYTEHTPHELLPFLREQFPVWPATARLYHEVVAVQHDVTPCTEQDAAALEHADGTYYVVVYPGDPLTAIIVAVAVFVVTAVLFMFLMPKIPGADNSQQSSNNTLGQRVNKPRPNGRIEDIFGTVISVPTMLTVPLLVFDGDLEVEICFMAVGRGSYDIADVRDGDTPLDDIAGAGAAFYGPGTSPNYGDPFLTIGTEITEGLLDVVRVNEVNGQVLRPPNSNAVNGNNDIRFHYPDTIERTGGADFTQFFEAGDELTVSAGTVDGVPAQSLTVLKRMRFESGGTIRFDAYNPTADFGIGQSITLGDASYTALTPATGAYTLSWNPVVLPSGHPAALDRLKTMQLVNGDPAKFYAPFHFFYHDIGTRCTFSVYQYDDAAGANPVRVAEFTDGGPGFSTSGLKSVQLSAVGGSGITGSMLVDFGGGSTAFASYSNDLTTAGLGAAAINTGQGTEQFVDLAGVYVVSGIGSSSILLTSPGTVNPDWNKLANYVNARTEYQQASLSRQVSAGGGLNLSGTYTVLAVNSSTITLADPSDDNPDWGVPLQSLPGNATPYLSPSLSTNGEGWIGPFVIKLECDQLLNNFVSLNGQFRTNDKNKTVANSTGGELEYTPLDADGNPTGGPIVVPWTVYGDGKDKNRKAQTLRSFLAEASAVSVRARRTTPTDLDYKGNIVDEVKWRDCFGTAFVSELDFGDLTTVHTRTYATAGALSVKDRKLNCRASRRVLVRNVDNTFGPELAASQNAADIICHMALDPFIGNRQLWELDVPQIYDTIAEVVAYFGFAAAGQFNTTFDEDNISFEEMVQTVAQAVFCSAYRQGSQLRLLFERATNDAVLLFNHRNKLPGSEHRTINFGTNNDNDGVELDYVSPKDGAKVTVYVPADQSAVKPRKIEMRGVADDRQADIHAARAFNKIKYQHTTSAFTATAEASQLVRGERVENTDNTRDDVNDGEVVSQDGLVLELSQPFTAVDGVDYTIYLQLSDGSVEKIDMVASTDAYHVVLQTAPSTALILDPDRWARTIYQIVGSTDVRPTGFLVVEKGAYDKRTVSVKAINYDARYYQNDLMHEGSD